MARSKEITKNGEFLKYSAKKKHVVIPSGIKTIGRSAFSGELITSVTFPGTVKKIDKGAFFRCRNLKSVEIPDSVTERFSADIYAVLCVKNKDYPQSYPQKKLSGSCPGSKDSASVSLTLFFYHGILC